uniref:Uncharacterized protein n=1 Tax=Avena sativa TaxID=4498 RepID=A0ACD5YIA4_AVESA
MGSYAYRYCMCFTRKFRSPDAHPPPDVRAAHAAAAAHAGGDGLRGFLAEVQGEHPSEADRILAALCGGAAGGIARFVGRSPVPTLDDFFGFLFSPDLNPPIANKVHQDMSAPISHYYVFTGHNSYLTGNQLNSDSSDIPIITALQRGVRVIELDMWPNSAKNHVEILHGGTLTAPVDILRCLKSIKEHAFSASTYPLIITLEDHLTADLQAKVAEMIRETFGDLLYVPSSDTLNEFPSPEALMKRIIISTKPPGEFKEFLKAQDNQKNSGKTAELAEEGNLRRLDSNADDSDGKDEPDEEEDDESEEEDPKFQPDTACEYRKLITIHAGKPKGHLRDALKVDPDKVRRLSLSETQLSKATVSHGADIISCLELVLVDNAKSLAFPNFQGHDKPLRLMQGFFRANGGCGYVKKPDFLLKIGPNGEVFDPKAIMPVKKTLKVKVYMGDGWRMDFSKTHFDAFSPPDFYARVGIAGVRADCVMKKTRTIEDQWVPVWDEEFSFPLTVPELALLRVEVQEYDMSEKHDFGGQTCLPVMELKQGIRAVPLHDRKGNRYKSVRLLMRFELV